MRQSDNDIFFAGCLPVAGVPEKLEMRETSLSNLMRRAERAVGSFAGRNLSISLSICEDDLRVKADASRMTEALVYLVRNATDSVPSGGSISLLSGRAAFNGLQSQYGACAYVAIKDSGSAFYVETEEGDYLTILPDRHHYEADDRIRIVRRIIAGHNGHLVIDSTPGAGTVAFIYLPLVKSPAEMLAPIPLGDRGGWENERVCAP